MWNARTAGKYGRGCVDARIVEMVCMKNYPTIGLTTVRLFEGVSE